MEEKWITSGSLGSRDTVLVFRHSLLKKKSEDIILSSKNETSDAYLKNACFNDFIIREDASGPKSYNKGLPSVDVKGNKILALQKHFSNLLNSDISNLKGESYEIDPNEKVVLATEEYSQFDMERGNSDETCQDFNKVSEEDDYKDIMHTPDMPAHKMKIKYKFVQTETKLLRKIFVRHGLSEVREDENFSILWTGVHIKPDILRNLAPYQRVNHFPR